MKSPTQSRTQLAAYTRVAILLCAAALLSLGVLGLQARARAHELIESTGERMLTYARAQHISAPRTLRLNGAALRLLSGSTQDSVTALLDFMHAGCRRAGGRFEEQLQEASRGRVPRIAGSGLDGVLRLNDEQSGYVACFDLGALKVEPAELLRRTQAFLDTGDLSQVGDLRFIWARRDGATTSYVAVFTEGPLPLLSMFPAQGDAPGADVPGLPRPLHSQRLLSTWQEDEAPMLVTYRLKQPLAGAEHDLRALLEKRGYRVDQQSVKASGRRALLAQRGPSQTLWLLTGDGTAKSLATAMPLR